MSRSLADPSPPGPYPPRLEAILSLFSGLDDAGRRENLIAYAGSADRCAPRPGETFDIEDIRKDEECTDTVGVHLRVEPSGAAVLRVSLGPKVQTLTRALTAILCKGFEGATPRQICDTPADFVPKITGAELVRLRSQTVYYVLSRIKTAAKMWLDRQRALAAQSLDGGPPQA